MIEINSDRISRALKLSVESKALQQGFILDKERTATLYTRGAETVCVIDAWGHCYICPILKKELLTLQKSTAKKRK